MCFQLAFMVQALESLFICETLDMSVRNMIWRYWGGCLKQCQFVFHYSLHHWVHISILWGSPSNIEQPFWRYFQIEFILWSFWLCTHTISWGTEWYWQASRNGNCVEGTRRMMRRSGGRLKESAGFNYSLQIHKLWRKSRLDYAFGIDLSVVINFSIRGDKLCIESTAPLSFLCSIKCPSCCYKCYLTYQRLLCKWENI